MKRDQITPKVLRDLLSYAPETGVLTWSARRPEVFDGGSKSPEHLCAIWNAKYAGTLADTQDGQGYVRLSIFEIKIRAHRAAWAIYYGDWPSNFIDHINGVRSDNRINNLRDVPRALNQRNMKLAKNNTSGTVGVTWNKALEKWEAKIQVNGKTKYFGVFSNKDDAIAARLSASVSNNFHINHGRVQ
jgi:hypothetical protein